MKSLLQSATFLLIDMASTIFFLILYALTKNLTLSVAAGVALGVAEIAFEFVRKRPVDAMQWLSLFLVVASGTAAVLTHDPRFVMFKASAIYVIVGAVMLKPGWMNRYLPDVAREIVPDVGVIFGFIWAGLMFLSAGVNAVAAMNFGFLHWGAFMSIYALSSKLGLFLIQFATMRFIGVRRRRAAMAGGGAMVAAQA
jgi:intracellular septation protein A